MWMKEKLEDLNVDGTIILRFHCYKPLVEMYTGFMWLRI
jgi:hypothetical protein